MSITAENITKIRKSDFIRYLKDGGKVQVLTLHLETPPAEMQAVRTPEKVNTVSCRFEGGSHLFFDSFSAGDCDSYFAEGKGVIFNIGWAEYVLLDVLTYGIPTN